MALHATIVPDAVVSAGSWTIGGGAASLNAALADASDATFAQSNVVNDKLIVSLGNIPALAAGQIVTSIKFVFRASAGLPYGANATAYVIDSSGGGPGVSIGPLSNVVGQSSTTLLSVNGPFTEAKVNGLQLVFLGSASANTFIHRAYVEVYTNSPPTATPSVSDSATISDTSGVNGPLRNWSYSDADGDAQEQVDIRVFSGSAVVADPENEKARLVAATGPVVYSGTVIDLGILAPNGPFVWAIKAKDVGGTWGPWAQRGVTYNMPTPPPPTITATPDPALARYEITVDDVAGTYPTEFFQIQQSDNSGLTYRGTYGATSLPFSGTPVTIYDYRATRMARPYVAGSVAAVGYNEAIGYNSAVGYNGTITVAATGPTNVVRFRARAGRVFNGVTIWSAWTEITPNNLVGNGTMWLKHPFDAAKSIKLQQVANWETTSEEDMAILRAANRQDFVVFAGVPSWKKGELELIFSSDAAYNAFEALRSPTTSLPATQQGAGLISVATPTSYLFQSCFGDTALEQVWMRLGPTLSTTRVTTGPQQHTNQYRRVKIGFVETKIPTA